MRILGIESSCDETGLAMYDTDKGLLAHVLHSQIALHAEYGGVVPELASRDHIRRIVSLLRKVLRRAGRVARDIDVVAYTQGPGLAGALLVGAAFAEGLAVSLNKPVLPVHHLEGHLLSPLLAADAPEFPFVALLVSGGHTQLMTVTGVGRYELLGETQDDAAGEAFDKIAKLLGLPYPGGPALSQLARSGRPGLFDLPCPMLNSGDFNFSFAGLKTAVSTRVRKQGEMADACFKADIARAFQDAVVKTLTQKSFAALRHAGMRRLVVAGGVGANWQLRQSLDAAAQERHCRVHYPALEFCTDNGAMIAFAAALRLQSGVEAARPAGLFAIKPRWSLSDLMHKACDKKNIAEIVDNAGKSRHNLTSSLLQHGSDFVL
ncbi:MAG: tRNA (adenosine(37)-N6)-threonylcarbamoyltransferase complex transferase subunit TsaD [Zoogloeaceae bacterium]|jgi:N6-L-threonylcarbamoyladenine synthase|nr:tRNA (adenosine(37)-N6)-threonylcarbamoyltransferase complex transferase subunit TsaD [Zoogloeaceae bacterium]